MTFQKSSTDRHRVSWENGLCWSTEQSYHEWKWLELEAFVWNISGNADFASLVHGGFKDSYTNRVLITYVENQSENSGTI